jgi:hypothetical protein
LWKFNFGFGAKNAWFMCGLVIGQSGKHWCWASLFPMPFEGKTQDEKWMKAGHFV